MFNHVLFSGPPICKNAFRGIESNLHITLPDDYKKFMSSYNGGRPEPDCFYFMNEEKEMEEESIGKLYSLEQFENVARAYTLKKYLFVQIGDSVSGYMIGYLYKDRKDPYLTVKLFGDGRTLNQFLPIIPSTFDKFLQSLFDSGGYGVIGYCMKYGDFTTFMALLKRKMITLDTKEGNRSLIENAAMMGCKEIFSYCLSRGCNLGKSEELAKINNNLEIIEIMRANGIE